VRPGSQYRYKLYGKWNDCVRLLNEETNEDIVFWKPKPKPANSDHMYHMTRFSLQLNYLEDKLAAKLPPTDSRFRPDQRALENGDFDLASDEKFRLEEK